MRFHPVPSSNMQITLNGKSMDVSDDLSAAELIRQLGLEGERLAMEINEEIAPRSHHEAIRLKPGDKVEIVRAIGGG